MRIHHLANAHWPAHATGVPRFSRDLKAAFPYIRNIGPRSIDGFPWREDDVVVADNHLALLVPEQVRVVVVHHGCAKIHYEREPGWRSGHSASMVDAQRRMLNRPNTTFVAPSRWVGERFREISQYEGWRYEPVLIPHWVEPIKPSRREPRERPVVTGHWGDHNKGRDAIGAITEALPEFEFRPLKFAPHDNLAKAKSYQDADVYLCLSLSEGAPYAVADAEAARLPIVSTEVGWVDDFPDIQVIANRDDPAEIRTSIRKALALPRDRVRFYDSWTYAKWLLAWREVIG